MDRPHTGTEPLISGISHLTFAVEDLERSVSFYEALFGTEAAARGENLAYFEVAGIWLALNREHTLKAADRERTYTHTAFAMSAENQESLAGRLTAAGIHHESGRPRSEREGRSLYVRDPDGHLFEFHNLTLQDRLSYYREERPDIRVR